MRPGGFFPTNPDLADFLGRTDLDFENCYFLDFLGSQISGLGPPTWAPRGKGGSKGSLRRFWSLSALGERSSWDLRVRPAPPPVALEIWCSGKSELRTRRIRGVKTTQSQNSHNFLKNHHAPNHSKIVISVKKMFLLTFPTCFQRPEKEEGKHPTILRWYPCWHLLAYY